MRESGLGKVETAGQANARTNRNIDFLLGEVERLRTRLSDRFEKTGRTDWAQNGSLASVEQGLAEICETLAQQGGAKR